MKEHKTNFEVAHAGMTVREARCWGSGKLYGALPGLQDTTDAEETLWYAEQLLCHVTGLRSLDIICEPGQLLTEQQAHAYNAAIARRLAHEPITRIIGMRDFHGREFLVTPAVLDPRYDTEVLISTALDLTAAAHPGGDRLRILDIGTGSGAILLTLLAELPAARGIGIDPSASALSVARANADRLGVADRCSWVEGRSMAGVTQEFDLVISNPPYIPTGDIADLQPDVRDFDPHLALDGGPDGLAIYRDIARDLANARPPAWIVLEVGDGQADDVRRVLLSKLSSEHWTTEIHRDLAGKPRCVAFSHRD